MDQKQLEQFNSLSAERKEKVLKTLEMEFMKETTEKRFKTNKAILKYFSKFNSSSVESFISSYLSFKEVWITKGSAAKKRNEDVALLFHRDARQAIKTILRKKLLMKICEWSADLVELEGVETSADFHYWNEDILNCPFLDLVKEQEIELYKQHFISPGFDEYEWVHLPYTYYFVKHDGESSGDSADRSSEPEFSMLYDTYMGTSAFWILPDKKCVKERYYQRIFNDNRMKKYQQDVADGTIVPKKADTRPYLSPFEKKAVETFVKRFESPELLANFREFAYDNKNTRDDLTGEEEQLRDFAAEALWRMEQLEISLPVEAADDYRAALKQAWDKYRQEQILKTIDNLFEDYLFRKQSGIQFERDERAINNMKETIDYHKMEIREGRRLVGEPADLNIFENL